MNLERYPVTATDQFRSFEFLSEGPQGTVKKVVYFQDYQLEFTTLPSVIGMK